MLPALVRGGAPCQVDERPPVWQPRASRRAPCVAAWLTGGQLGQGGSEAGSPGRLTPSLGARRVITRSRQLPSRSRPCVRDVWRSCGIATGSSNGSVRFPPERNYQLQLMLTVPQCCARNSAFAKASAQSEELLHRAVHRSMTDDRSDGSEHMMRLSSLVRRHRRRNHLSAQVVGFWAVVVGLTLVVQTGGAAQPSNLPWQSTDILHLRYREAKGSTCFGSGRYHYHQFKNDSDRRIQARVTLKYRDGDNREKTEFETLDLAPGKDTNWSGSWKCAGSSVALTFGSSRLTIPSPAAASPPNELRRAADRLLDEWQRWLRRAARAKLPFDSSALREYKANLTAATKRVGEFEQQVQGLSSEPLSVTALETFVTSMRGFQELLDVP